MRPARPELRLRLQRAMPRSRSYAESTIAERVCCGLFSSHVRLVTTVAGLYGSVFSLVCCATAAYLAYNDESDAQAGK